LLVSVTIGTYNEHFHSAGVVIMDGIATEIERDVAGRFAAGQSGNPAGKKPGTKNRKTVMLAALRDGEGEAAARVVIEKAVAGDAVAARFVVSLVSPRPRGRTIHLEMPEGDDCNVVTAFNVTLRALCNGEITPEEALQVSRFLDGRRKVLQAWQLEEKLTSYGRTIPGDPEWAPDDAEEDDEDDEDDADTELTEEQMIALVPERASAVEGAVPAAAAAPSGPDGETADPAAPRLQSACNSGSAPLPDALAVADRFDAALVGSVVRRLVTAAASIARPPLARTADAAGGAAP
jgi:hypothetical protein